MHDLDFDLSIINIGYEMEKKFYYPDLLHIAQQISRYEEIIDNLNENLVVLLGCENENNKNYSELIGVILNQIFDKTLDLNTELRNLQDEFPYMSMDEWTILRQRWEIFIDENDDLKLYELE